MKVDEEFALIYKKQAELMKNTERRTMEINLRHLFEYDTSYELRDLVINEYVRYEPFLEKSVGDLMKKLFFEWANKKNFYISFTNIPNVDK